jgi:DtxR family Mn-dependent transcriptional regulator
VSELIDTTEMYLRTILELEEEDIVPLRARIAERLHQSGPTVSQTVARMERDGLLTVSGDRHLVLSTVGRERAVRVMRKHRLAERLLTDIIGLDWEDVHDEACRWEHVISDDVEKRLVEILGDPLESPYGNPIPGRKASDGTSVAPDHSQPLSELIDPSRAVQLKVRRIGENLQTGHDVMTTLHRSGILPGAEIEAAFDVDGVRLTGVSGSCVIEIVDADQIFALAVERG